MKFFALYSRTFLLTALTGAFVDRFGNFDYGCAFALGFL